MAWAWDPIVGCQKRTGEQNEPATQPPGPNSSIQDSSLHTQGPKSQGSSEQEPRTEEAVEC